MYLLEWAKTIILIHLITHIHGFWIIDHLVTCTQELGGFVAKYSVFTISWPFVHIELLFWDNSIYGKLNLVTALHVYSCRKDFWKSINKDS